MALEYDAVTSSDLQSIYKDYSPAYRNLYEVCILNSSGGSDDSAKEFSFLTTSISVKGEELRLKRNDVSKLFQVEDSNAYTWVDELSIKWREQDDWAVRKYHSDWISKFYSKENNHFLSAQNTNDIQSRYRTIKVLLPPTADGKKPVVTFSKVLPKVLPGVDLEWSKDSSVVTHQISYYIGGYRFDE